LFIILPLRNTTATGFHLTKLMFDFVQDLLLFLTLPDVLDFGFCKVCKATSTWSTKLFTVLKSF